jgi:pre-mRNA-splicing factor ATP-dependent RNA helicase DHX16
MRCLILTRTHAWAQRGDEREAVAEDAAVKRRQLAADAAARIAAMPSLRERSRQEYLTKREPQKVEQLRLLIREEERLFGSERLTERERAELATKKELLRLAEERMHLSDNVERYHMPEGTPRCVHNTCTCLTCRCMYAYVCLCTCPPLSLSVGSDYEDEKGRLDRKRQQEVLYGRYEATEDKPGQAPNDNDSWEKQQVPFTHPHTRTHAHTH